MTTTSQDGLYRWSYRQDQLSEICGALDTQLQTSEIHAANDYYGQATVLKRYAGVSTEKPLKFVVEHGVHLDDIVWQLDMDAPLSLVMSCSPWRAEVHRRHTNKEIIPGGFGYLYARDVVCDEAGEDPVDSDRRGTLAFPVHSTHTIKARFDHQAYAAKLAALPAEFQPVYLCVYWKDFLDGVHRHYEAEGIRVVSSGHMYDPEFMLRFHDLCRQFRYAVSNAVGTHLFQAVASGCRFFMLDSDPIDFDIPESDRPHCGQFNPLFQQAESEARRLFAAPQAKITAEQRALVDHYLGTEWQLDRAGMRRLIRRTEWLDRTVPRSTLVSDGQRVFAPPAWARNSQTPLRHWAKLKRSLRKRISGRKAG